MHKIKLAMARDKGPGFIMDMAQIPKNKPGWSIDKWMSVLDNYGMAIINSLETDEKGNRTQFNQFQSIDRSTASSLLNYVSFAQFLVQSIADITGISRQREGQTEARETASGIERSVTQSTSITEAIFYIHNEVKKRVLNRLVDVAKVSYKEGDKISYVLDDLGRKYIDITKDFKNSEYGVYVSNSAFDLKILETLKVAAQVSLQQKEITLYDYIVAMKSQSAAEIEHILKDAETNNQERQSKQQQQAAEMQKQVEQEKMKQATEMQKIMEQTKVEAQIQLEEVKGNIDKDLQQMKNDASIEVAKINAEGRIVSYRTDLTADANQNNIADVAERHRLQFEREKLSKESEFRTRELGAKEKELGIKEKEAEAKMIAAKKPATSTSN